MTIWQAIKLLLRLWRRHPNALVLFRAGEDGHGDPVYVGIKGAVIRYAYESETLTKTRKAGTRPVIVLLPNDQTYGDE